MTTTADLTSLAARLRHTQTRLLPLELAEQIQHAIVRIEALAGAPLPRADAVHAAVDEGERLLATCERLLARP